MIGITSSINRLAGSMNVDAAHLPTPQALGGELQKVNDLISKVNDKYSVVEIVGSNSALDAAREWLGKCVEALTVLTSSITISPAFRVDAPKVTATLAKMMEAASLQTKFLDKARSDMNVYG